MNFRFTDSTSSSGVRQIADYMLCLLLICNALALITMAQSVSTKSATQPIPVTQSSNSEKDGTKYRRILERRKANYERKKNAETPDSLTTSRNALTSLVISDLSTQSPTQLVQRFIGNGVTFSNVRFTRGASRAGGSFSGGTGIIGFEDGLVLSSGDVKNVVGPNNRTDESTANNTPGDSSLSSISSQPTQDAAVLEFDFVPDTNVLSFQYVFGSEEYNESTNGQFVFNDSFAFFVNDNNVALVPNTNTPISVSRINGGTPFGTDPQNAQFYRNNDFQDGTAPIDTQLDGLTTVLNIQVSVRQGQTNHIKLAIADARDNLGDSAVFVRRATPAASQATTLNVAPVNGTFNSAPRFSATLLSVSNQPIGNRTINFFRNGVAVGNATTNENGVAMVNVSLAGIAPGNYPNGVRAVFAGDAAFNGSEGTNRVIIKTAFDFEGDGRADISVFRNGDWYLLNSSSGFRAVNFGVSTDKLVPADYDGDGKTDIAVFRNGNWYILNSANNNFQAVQFGATNDVLVPADYSGDGRAEIAVFRNGNWYTLNLANNQFQAVQYGLSNDKPVPADYDGDGITDLAVFRPSNATWFSTTGINAQFGSSSDVPVIGDFNGDGRSDLTVFRPSNATWYIAKPNGVPAQNFDQTMFGVSTDKLVPADYDGDGKTDIAVFRNGNWYLLRSQQGFNAVQFGAANDQPIPAAFLP